MSTGSPQRHRAEPAVLANGKAFGRTAVLFAEGGSTPYYVVIEVKNTRWDLQAPHRVRPNLLRHIRQVGRYLMPLMDELDKGTASGLQGALLYPSRPRTPGRAVLISTMAEDEGLTVVYHDELGAATP
jgi:hypothetical protein